MDDLEVLSSFSLFPEFLSLSAVVVLECFAGNEAAEEVVLGCIFPLGAGSWCTTAPLSL